MSLESYSVEATQLVDGTWSYKKDQVKVFCSSTSIVSGPGWYSEDGTWSNFQSCWKDEVGEIQVYKGVMGVVLDKEVFEKLVETAKSERDVEAAERKARHLEIDRLKAELEALQDAEADFEQRWAVYEKISELSKI